mmetsp:Transcript_38573/g.92161  ORF Transcript_38573/g.92161 Transcript_38573/m.92161 type:complete len:291 (-) Transcript_38573:270-1142(-)
MGGQEAEARPAALAEALRAGPGGHAERQDRRAPGVLPGAVPRGEHGPLPADDRQQLCAHWRRRHPATAPAGAAGPKAHRGDQRSRCRGQGPHRGRQEVGASGALCRSLGQDRCDGNGGNGFGATGASGSIAAAPEHHSAHGRGAQGNPGLLAPIWGRQCEILARQERLWNAGHEDCVAAGAKHPHHGLQPKTVRQLVRLLWSRGFGGRPFELGGCARAAFPHVGAGGNFVGRRRPQAPAGGGPVARWRSCTSRGAHASPSAGRLHRGLREFVALHPAGGRWPHQTALLRL